MSVVEPVVTEAIPVRAAIEPCSQTGLYRMPVYVGCALLALLINYVLGKDLPWDTLDYHFYAGFEALHNRFALDYFPAGVQSYFNPYVYAPFYALVRSGLSPLQISSIEAVVQSAILWLTYELAIEACPAQSSRGRVCFGLCAVGFALANPILMQQLGSSFADITTGVLVVGAWLLLAKSVRQVRLSLLVWAGLIIGAAVALKPTNSVHALAAGVVVLFVPLALRGKLRCALAYGVAAFIGFVVVAAPWSYQLERAFGNPMFPLMNGVFRSPEFTTEHLLHYRFIPVNLWEALWRPFAIAIPAWMTQEEMRAPDVRYALVAILAVTMLIWQLIRTLRQTKRPADATARGSGDARGALRVLTALGSALLIDWAAWLVASGNGRYFLPMACVTAVVAMALVFRLFAARPKVLAYAVAAVFIAQGTQLALGTDYRWNGHPWSEHWLDVEVPKALATQPNLYLDIGLQSNSFILPYLAPGSGLINFGGYELSAKDANGARVAALVRRFGSHVRVLTAGDRLYADDEHAVPRRSAVDAALAAFDLHIDASDCQTIVADGLEDDVHITFTKQAPQGPRHMLHLLSCHLLPGGVIPSAWAAQQQDAETVLNRLEAACPQLFQPRGSQIQPFGEEGWMRYYLNTDEMAWVSRGWLKFDDPVSGDGVVFLGRVSDWLKSTPRVLCGRRDGHYYASLPGLQPKGKWHRVAFGKT